MTRPLMPWRVAVGFLAAFIVPGLVVDITFEQISRLGNALSFGVIFMPSVFLFGPTMLLLYRRMGWEGWWSFALGGAAVGVVSLSLLGLTLPGDGIWGFLELSGGFGAIGALALRAALYVGVRPV